MIAANRIFVAALLFGAIVSCSKDREPAKAPPPAVSAASAGTAGTVATAPAAALPVPAKPNLVLITMEATRADHLGCYEYSFAKTPVLDELAREGVIFSKATAVAPLTLPSHASIFTGLYPPRHGVRVNSGAKLQESETTIAEHLRAQGYATAASIGTQLLAGDSGFRQGFDSYAEPKRATRNAAFVVDDAIEAVNKMKGRPFFLWVQLNDPHAPYAPPPGFRAAFENRLYDGEIAWMDAQLKRLVDHLRAQGLYDNTVVVATADHGESLGEHGEETHGVFLYDSTLKVPLIMRYPHRIVAGAKFTGLVSGVDLAPTLLELMGLPPLPNVQGESCAARMAGGGAPEREAVYAESLFGERAFGWAPLRALRTADEKFIDAPEAELYQLKRDPAETINLATDQAKAVTDTWRPSLAEALRTIGGDDAEGTAGRTHRKAARDPKTLIAAANFFLKAQSAVEEGQPEQAAPLLKQALAKDPGNPAAKSLLAALRGEPSPSSGPATNTFAAQWNLGNALYVHGKLDEAAKAFRAALAIKPQSAETHYALGNVLAAKGDSAGAEAELRAAVAGDPKMADGWNKLGIVLQKANRRPEALAAYSRALEASPDDADALFNRAKLELLEKNLPDARRDVDHLLAKHKDYAPAGFLDAHICVAEGNSAGAKDALTKFLALPQADPRMKAAATDMLQKLGG
jgi:arylsulfatase A-like enzyme/Tfp pilus assembly protein PilF